MLIVHKYILSNETEQTLLMPIGAKILRVATQHTVIVLWALVNPDKKLKKYRIGIYLTGVDVSETHKNLKHISTLLLYGGNEIIHVFRLPDPK